MSSMPSDSTQLVIGSQAIDAYSRLSYSMWHALAEFIDNSTQSRTNYESIIDGVLAAEGTPLTVRITHQRPERTLLIEDNSIGMTRADLVAALNIAQPTADSKGRSRYGMGMKTAACWIGKRWQIVTCEWGSGEEWTADIDVRRIANGDNNIPLVVRPVSRDQHYTRIIISGMHRNIQRRTEETIRGYLGSIYRFDLLAETLKLVYNGEDIPAPAEYEFDRDPQGLIMKRVLPPGLQIGGKSVSGWVAVLLRGGRKFGGFSLFQNQRQIQGFPNAWKPKSIYGGVDDEGANNLVAQRLIGEIQLDERFPVSHTKDAILFEGDEEEELETLLEAITKDYRTYAQRRRGRKGSPLTRENVHDFVAGLQSEFMSTGMQDAVDHAILPPLETIIQNNQALLTSLSEADAVGELNVADNIRVVVSLKQVSEYEPYVTLVAGAAIGTIHVIINGLHPYYAELDSVDAVDECVRQYIYDAIAEYRVTLMRAALAPDAIRRLKETLLRVKAVSQSMMPLPPAAETSGGGQTAG